MTGRYDPTRSISPINNSERFNISGKLNDKRLNELSNHFYSVFKYAPLVNVNPNINATFEERQFNYMKKKEENKQSYNYINEGLLMSLLVQEIFFHRE